MFSSPRLGHCAAWFGRPYSILDWTTCMWANRQQTKKLTVYVMEPNTISRYERKPATDQDRDSAE